MPTEPAHFYEDGRSKHLDLNMDYNEMHHIKVIGVGSMCIVARAKMDHKQVALKWLKDDVDPKSAARDLENELTIMQLLHHPHIVQLIGAGMHDCGRMFICMEYLPGGTLSEVLGTDNTRSGFVGMEKWVVRHRVMPFEKAIRHGIELASAIDYLHTKAMPGCRLLHRDLKGSNVAFAADGSLKLLDFGLARVARSRDAYGHDRYKMTGCTGSLRYMSPEVALSKPYNHKADVYSFSIILWEMLALERPYDLLSVENLYQDVVEGGVRPQLDRSWPQSVRTLLSRCWSADIDKRPEMAEVVGTLQEVYQTSSHKS